MYSIASKIENFPLLNLECRQNVYERQRRSMKERISRHARLQHFWGWWDFYKYILSRAQDQNIDICHAEYTYQRENWHYTVD